MSEKSCCGSDLWAGGQLDVRYEEDAVDENEVIQRLIETLAADSGVLRTRHGDRLIRCSLAGAWRPLRWRHAAQSCEPGRLGRCRRKSRRAHVSRPARTSRCAASVIPRA